MTSQFKAYLDEQEEYTHAHIKVLHQKLFNILTNNAHLETKVMLLQQKLYDMQEVIRTLQTKYESTSAALKAQQAPLREALNDLDSIPEEQPGKAVGNPTD